MLLWAMQQPKEMNWAHLVVSHMLRCQNSGGQPLLYGVLVTKVLHHFRIPFSGEEVQKGEDAYHTFGSATINQMHLELNDGAWWYRTPRERFFAAPRQQAPEPVPAPPASDAASSSTMPITLEQYRSLFEDFRAQQLGMFDGLRQEILLSREIHSREMAALDARITALEVHYAGLRGTSAVAPDSDQPMGQQGEDADEP